MQLSWRCSGWIFETASWIRNAGFLRCLWSRSVRGSLAWCTSPAQGKSLQVSQWTAPCSSRQPCRRPCSQSVVLRKRLSCTSCSSSTSTPFWPYHRWTLWSWAYLCILRRSLLLRCSHGSSAEVGHLCLSTRPTLTYVWSVSSKSWGHHPLTGTRQYDRRPYWYSLLLYAVVRGQSHQLA